MAGDTSHLANNRLEALTGTAALQFDHHVPTVPIARSVAHRCRDDCEATWFDGVVSKRVAMLTVAWTLKLAPSLLVPQ